MKCKAAYLVLLAISALLASCASQPITLAPVGPRPVGWKQVVSDTGNGQLQVWTETDEYEYDKDVPFYPHRDYQVYTADGRHLERVWNAQTHEDETPATVDLPAGKYLIKADAEFSGLVMIPVVIKAHRLTRVVLQPGWEPEGRYEASDLVRSPAGYFVGWRAEAANGNGSGMEKPQT